MKTISPTSTGRSLSRALKGAHALGLAVLSLGTASNSRGAAPWGTPIMEPGIAAVSCAVPANVPFGSAYVFALFDFRTPPIPHSGLPFLTASYGPNGPASPLWNPPNYHHPSWTVTNLGNVYGIAIDADGDMYTGAHGLYSKTWGTYYHQYGGLGGWNGTAAQKLAAAGTVYKIDRNTGVASVFAVIPGQQTMNLSASGGTPFSAGPGLGNIAFDPDPLNGGQFFVTSLEDGKIYRINNVGAIVQTFDPLTADTGAVGMPPAGERLWGIGVSRGAVHYAIWNAATAVSPCKIRRVNLVAGAIVPGTDVEILTVPFSPKATGSQYTPVADITFSADGTKMVLGERTMLTEANSYNHDSRVHIVDTTTWTVLRTLETGNSWGRGEAYGGVAYGPENGGSEQLIWMTSADTAGPPGPHGIQGTRPADFPLAATPAIVVNSYRVPFDPAATTAGPDNKGSGGDVEIMPTTGSCCMRITNKAVDCIATNMTYQWQFCVTNCSKDIYKYLSFPDLPPGVTLSQDIVTLPSVLNPGQGTCLTLYITNTAGLTNLCFTVGAHTTNFFVCCSVTNCITFAPCCVYISAESVVPVPGSGCFNYTFTVKNVTVPPIPIKYLFLVQDPAPPPTCVTFTPDILVLPPLLPGASIVRTVKVCFTPGCKGPFYFLAGASDTNLVHCCSTRHCIPPASIIHPIKIADRFDGAVFLAGSTIRVPVVIDRSIVQPSRAIGYDGTNAIASIVDPADGQHDDWFVLSNAVAGTHILTAELIDTLGGEWWTEEATVYVVEERPPGSAPAPLLTGVHVNNQRVIFSMQTTPGVTYHVECSDSLTAPKWQTLETIAGDGGVSALSYSCTNSPQRFYRVRVQ